MSFRPAAPPPKYNSDDQAYFRQAFEAAERTNLKRNRDIEMGRARIILTSPDGTRYALIVDNSGVLSTVTV
jgi:hypothetical protein